MPSPAMDTPIRLPLVGKLQVRRVPQGGNAVVKDARLYNGFAEYDAEDQQYWIYKRPGLSATPLLQLPGGFGKGLGVYQSPNTGFNTLLFVIGSVLNMGFTGPIYEFLNSSDNISYAFETVKSNPVTVVMGNTVAQYLVTPSTSSVQVISSLIPGNPTKALGWAYLNGTVYVMDIDGAIWGSNINDATTWDPLDQIQASSGSDNGVALVKQLTYIIALKQNSAQVFYDTGVGSPGSTLAPVPDSQIPLGCFAATTVKTIDNTVLWVTSNESASPQVVQMDNLTPKIISTPGVERLLENIFTNYAGIGVYGWVFKLVGHRFYGLTILNLNLTLVYDLDQQLWYLWTDTLGNYWPISNVYYEGGIASGGQNIHVAQRDLDGSIYELDGQDGFNTDFGNLTSVDIYTPNYDAGVDRKKTLNMMRFNADQVSGSVLNVRRSDDDYQKWSNFRNVSLSRKRPILTQEGSFYRRAYHFRHRCPTTFRIKTVDLQMDIGVS